MRIAALLLLLGGCDQLFHLDPLPEPDPESQIDAAVGQLIDSSGNCANGNFYGQYGPNHTGLIEICIPSTVTDREIAGDIDTTDPASCDVALVIDTLGTEVCVRWGASIAVSSLRATGNRALVIAASGALVVSGTVDVSSHKIGFRGAGGNWVGCANSEGATELGGGSGGAGGSFGTFGGSGGANSKGTTITARATAAPDRVRGGCEGGDGGDGEVNVDGGPGGKSGGAIYFIAGAALDVTDGTIVNASGMGGRGAPGAGLTWIGGAGGGGGGGSGGLIGLDSPSIRIGAARFLANGGGGGGGGAAASGTDGAEPSQTAITTPAPGGLGTTLAGKGGNGAATTTNGGAGFSGKAGGGGGGGLGHIVVFTQNEMSSSGMFSPAPKNAP